MRLVKIVADESSNLENDFVKKHKITVIPFKIINRQGKIIKILVPIFAAAAILMFLRQPNGTTEIVVPTSNLLEDEEVASYALDKVIDEELINEMTEIEDYFPFELDEVFDELTIEEKVEFVKGICEKYSIEYNIGI